MIDMKEFQYTPEELARYNEAAHELRDRILDDETRYLVMNPRGTRQVRADFIDARLAAYRTGGYVVKETSSERM